jgi:hypothetical protein
MAKSQAAQTSAGQAVRWAQRSLVPEQEFDCRCRSEHRPLMLFASGFVDSQQPAMSYRQAFSERQEH